jgi:hypothetical protein
MKKSICHTIISAVVVSQLWVIGHCQDTTLLELSYGNGQNEVSLIPKEVDDPLAGCGPIDFVVDEKNELIYILDWAHDYRIICCDYKGDSKGVLTNKKYGNGLAGKFDVDSHGDLYILTQDKDSNDNISIFDATGNEKSTVNLKVRAPIQEMHLDANGTIWTSTYYGGETYRVSSKGDVITKFGKERIGLTRSKGKYFLKRIHGEKQTRSREQLLCDAKENVLLRVPESTILLGADSYGNSYLNVSDKSEHKQYIWIINAKGQVLKKHQLDCELHDQDNFLQVFIAESGNIYVAPNSDKDHKFKIIKIEAVK